MLPAAGPWEQILAILYSDEVSHQMDRSKLSTNSYCWKHCYRIFIVDEFPSLSFYECKLKFKQQYILLTLEIKAIVYQNSLLDVFISLELRISPN